MWVSRRTDYATRAVLALAISRREEPMNVAELSRRTQVASSMLEQVMPVLRRDGIVRSQRGRNGGYQLNHDPEDLTLERVVRLFEGQLAPIECATRNNPEPCPMDVGCSLRSVWEEVRDVVIERLEATTFADLAQGAGGAWANPRSLPVVTT